MEAIDVSIDLWYRSDCVLTVCCSPATRIRLPTNQSRAGDICERSNLTIGKSNVNMLASTILRSVKKRCKDGV